MRSRMRRGSLASSLKSKRAGRTDQHKPGLQVGVNDTDLEACKLSLTLSPHTLAKRTVAIKSKQRSQMS